MYICVSDILIYVGKKKTGCSDYHDWYNDYSDQYDDHDYGIFPAL